MNLTGRRNDDLDVTVAIKTFERPRTLAKTVQSIRRRYPRLRILVADDSEHPSEFDDPSTEVVELPFDSGISAGRNALIERASTEWVFLIDDDMMFVRETRVNRMVELARQYSMDILGASVYEPLRSRRRFFRKNWGRTRNAYETNIELVDGVLRWLPGVHCEDENVTECDLVHNGFLARTERLREIGGWADELKVAEHVEFFLRAKRNGLRVGFTDTSRLLHNGIMQERRHPRYHEFRTRTPEFRRRWLELDGVEWVVKADGTRYSADEYVEQASLW